MKIYTKTGDNGLTSLFGGSRVYKNDPRVEAYGSVDELNSWIGLLRDQESLIETPGLSLENSSIENLSQNNILPRNPSMEKASPEDFPMIFTSFLKIIQENLFVIGSHLASDESSPNKSLPKFSESETEILERQIDFMETKLQPLKHFILPGGHPSVSFVHIARNVCRRVERLVVALPNSNLELKWMVIYFNRLSDFLFVLARYWTYILGVPEYKWIPNPR